MQPTRKTFLNYPKGKPNQNKTVHTKSKRARLKCFFKKKPFSYFNACGGWRARTIQFDLVEQIEENQKRRSIETGTSGMHTKWRQKRQTKANDEYDQKDERNAFLSEVSSQAPSFTGSYLQRHDSSIASPSILFDDNSTILKLVNHDEHFDENYSLTEMSSLDDEHFNDILQFEQTSGMHWSAISVSPSKKGDDSFLLRDAHDDDDSLHFFKHPILQEETDSASI